MEPKAVVSEPVAPFFYVMSYLVWYVKYVIGMVRYRCISDTVLLYYFPIPVLDLHCTVPVEQKSASCHHIKFKFASLKIQPSSNVKFILQPLKSPIINYSSDTKATRQKNHKIRIWNHNIDILLKESVTSLNFYYEMH